MSRAPVPPLATERASLPPMVPYEEVMEKQRGSDRREYRKYLVDSGAIKALVKLHTNTFKDMRLDNPELLNKFFEEYQGDCPADVEADSLANTNALLREQSDMLSMQMQALETQVRSAIATRLWQGLTSAEFWEPRGIEAGSFSKEGMSGEQLYERLCGNAKDEAAAGKVLVDLLRPTSLTSAAMPRKLHLGSICSWLRYEASDDLVEWCRTDLIPRFVESPADPPFEFDVTADFRASDLYPHRVIEAARALQLNPPGLADFVKALAWRFSGDLERTPVLLKLRLMDSSEAGTCDEPPPTIDDPTLLKGGLSAVEVIGFDGPRQAGILMNEVRIPLTLSEIANIEDLLAQAAAEGMILVASMRPAWI